MLTRDKLLQYVSVVLDDALGVQPVSAMKPDARLVGWQCGFEPMVIAVQSYLPDTRIEAADAEDIAADYLTELGWWSDGVTDADFII